jgi:hypothetical protein
MPFINFSPAANYEDSKVSSSIVSGVSLLLMRVLVKAGQLTLLCSESESGSCRVIPSGTLLVMLTV